MPHLKQRFIWFLSLTGSALANVAFAWVKSTTDAPAWAPFVIIFVFLLSFGFGAGPIPWFGVPTADTEKLALRRMAIAMAAVACLNWVLVTLIALILDSVGDWEKNLHWIFGGVSALGAIWGICTLPNPRREVVDHVDPDLQAQLARFNTAEQDSIANIDCR
jgi:hypothetical protein